MFGSEGSELGDGSLVGCFEGDFMDEVEIVGEGYAAV